MPPGTLPPGTRPPGTGPPEAPADAVGAELAPADSFGSQRSTVAALVACVVVIALAATTLYFDRAHDRATASTPPPEVAAAAAAGLPLGSALPPLAAPTVPVVDLLIESETQDAELPRAATELADALGRGGAATFKLRALPNATPLRPAARAGVPTLAVVRADVLKAAPASAAALTVIAPLYTDAIAAVVRADSPLQYLHQLKGKRINGGERGSGRALTTAGVYRAMFSATAPATPATSLAADAALRLLLARGPLDAVLLVGEQAEPLLEALPPAQRASLRVLRLASDHPASQRALRSYLATASSGPDDRSVASLAALNFLVASARPDPGDPALFTALAHQLCAQLGPLRRDGDRKWREVQPGFEIPLVAGGKRLALNAAWAQCR